MSEQYILQLINKLFTNYNDVSPEELAILSQVPTETPPPGIESNFEESSSLKRPTIIVVSILLVLVFIFLTIRVHVKILITKKLTWDDATLSVGVLCMLLNIGAGLWGTGRGKMGVHSWNISVLTPLDMNYRVPSFISVIIPPITFGAIKASFFLLYLELFRPLKWIQRFSWIGLILNVCGYLAFHIVFLYNSIPRPGESFRTRLATQNIPVGLAISVFGLVLDLLILALPIVAVSNLRMSKRKRFGAALVFLSGTLACVCSILSVYYRKLLMDGHDQNWYVAVVELVFLVEVMIGVVCACAPSATYWSRHASIAQSIRKTISSSISSISASQRTSQLSSRVWPARRAGARPNALAHHDQLSLSLDAIPLSTFNSGPNNTLFSVSSEPFHGDLDDVETLPPVIYRHQEFDVESRRVPPP